MSNCNIVLSFSSIIENPCEHYYCNGWEEKWLSISKPLRRNKEMIEYYCPLCNKIQLLLIYTSYSKEG